MYTSERLFDDHDGPMLIRPLKDRLSLSELVASDRAGFKQKLLEHGALLFRGFDVKGVADFDDFVANASDQCLEYMYRSTPRTGMSERVFTATNYPKALEIPLHNENSYQRSWPLTLAFCCTVAAMDGGETPIAPMEWISERIGGDLMDKFEQRGVEYIRHYHKNVDLPWQSVFQTDSPEVVESYCANHDIQCTWLDRGLLRTTQVCHGVAYHPVTQRRVFFNQAHLFHVSSLGQSATAMIDMFGADKLPRHARYGDQEEISADELRTIRHAFKSSQLTFRWHPGDVLLLDNMQYAHGRRPFKGERAVYAALMDPFAA
jgi:alpha-ketoglutarate-dependent taurine dioxygenase